MPVNIMRCDTVNEAVAGPLPMSDDFAVALGLKDSIDPETRNLQPRLSDWDRFLYLTQKLLPRLVMEIEDQQQVIFSRFTALYVVALLEKWRACDSPMSSYAAMLPHISDNPYFQTFLISGHPAAQGITLLHAERMSRAEWDNIVHQDAVFQSCQFLSTMLVYEDSDTVLPLALTNRLIETLSRWVRTFASVPNMEPIARTLGLLRRQPTWVSMGRQVRAKAEAKLRCCNKPGCTVPYVPNVDTLQQCSRCKTARYCSQEHQRRHWKEHKMYCFPPVWV